MEFTAGIRCSGNLSRPSCDIPNPEGGTLDALAGTRLIISLLSILGTVSIIVSVIARRQVTNAKIHPIFVLSVADLMLAILWVIGALLWMNRAYVFDRAWCYSVSLLTVILELVTVNLTLVYALHAYANIKHTYRSFGVIPVSLEESTQEHTCGVWHPLKTISLYTIFWICPFLIVLIPFGIISGLYHIVRDANDCSCWCIPLFGNIIPFAFPTSDDVATALYAYHTRKLVLAYGVILTVHYLSVFVLLVIVYSKVWKHIQRMKQAHEQSRTIHYGAVKLLIDKGKSQARKRILYFMNVFVISGFFNFILSCLFVIDDIQALVKEEKQYVYERRYHSLHTTIITVLFLQSLTVPLQGLLNAVVYGWTREDFVKTVTAERAPVVEEQAAQVTLQSEESHGDCDSPLLISVEKEDNK